MTRSLSRIIRAGIIAGLALAAVPASANQIIRVVDGDTLVARINGVEERIRLLYVDTPEPGGRAKCANEARLADQATAAVNSLIRLGDTLTIAMAMRGSHPARDRYGRILADIHIGGRSLSQWLLDAGYARRWPDGPKFWCQR